mgnify:CR=1 FL=1
MLVTIDNVLNAEELATLRQLLRQTDWDNGRVTAGAQAAVVKNNQQVAEHSKALPMLREIVLNALQRTPLFFTAALPLQILPPFFNRYAESTNAYGFHTDAAMRLVPNRAGTYLRADVSATLFLSDPEAYEGGVLTIADTFGDHGIKRKAGSLVVYPSTSIHAVSPVTRGERLACFMFIQSMVRDAGKRRLLYDMDMALLRLREELGETESIVQLTGTYHNLLRQWAEN